MADKRQIEIFSAGCPACQQAVEQVQQMTCRSCEVTVLDMHDPHVARRAQQLGIRRVPAVVVDGLLAECCRGGGIDEQALRRAGIGQPIT